MQLEMIVGKEKKEVTSRMKFHWGHYCIFITVVLALLAIYIFFNPMLDTAFTPIKVYDRPLYLTHNYVEMVAFFIFGIGISKSLHTKSLYIYSRFIQVIIWLILALYSVSKAVELSLRFILLSFVGVILLAFPLPLGFYLYEFYCWRITKR